MIIARAFAAAVEDEERVRNFSVEALRELGYSVVHAANGAEAMKIIEGGQDVTLLFTDVVMPLAGQAKDEDEPAIGQR
jgi:CheY-like chemotaxis protein